MKGREKTALDDAFNLNAYYQRRLPVCRPGDRPIVSGCFKGTAKCFQLMKSSARAQPQLPTQHAFGLTEVGDLHLHRRRDRLAFCQANRSRLKGCEPTFTQKLEERGRPRPIYI